MRCKEALRLISPYLDGELDGARASVLESHVEGCAACADRLAFMRGVLREVASLPAIQPTPAESYRLMNRIRGEMAAPAAHEPAMRWARVTAATLSILVLLSVGVTWAVLGTAEPATRVEEPGTDARDGTAAAQDDPTHLGEGERTAGYGLDSLAASASLAKPSLVVSGDEYTANDLCNFRNDLGTKLDFYSTYWQAAASGGGAAVARLQEQLVDDLSRQAAAAGKDPAALQQAVDTALAEAGDEHLLPCYAEAAKVGGQDVWLISLSSPEDGVLFADPSMSRSMVLASLGGEEGMKISESTLKELASALAPYYTPYNGGAKAAAKEGAASGETANNGGGWVETPVPGESQGQGAEADDETVLQQKRERQFQSFLRQIAAQTNNLDLIDALEGLNYQQVLLLIQGNWGALAAGGVNLIDFLKPPQLLWATDATGTRVVWP